MYENENDRVIIGNNGAIGRPGFGGGFRPNRPGYGPGFRPNRPGYGFGGGFGVPFLLGAATGAIINPNPYYQNQYPYYPYPNQYPYYY